MEPKVDKKKLEKLFLDYGLSERRSENLAGYLENKDILEVEVERPRVKTRTISEVVKEE